jgi:hypothetical protein
VSGRRSGRASNRPIAGAGKIIRHRHAGRFTLIPNSIFEDDRLSIGAKGLLGYLISRPPNWQTRHDQLQKKLGVGRKLLKKFWTEIIDAGYGDRDERQGRDEHNRFTPLNYIIRDIPTSSITAAPKPPHSEPLHLRSSGNNKDETNLNKPFSKSLPNKQQGETPPAHQAVYTDFGQHAVASGQRPVYVGSKPHQAWVKFRGEDGMPGFIDCVIVDGKSYQVLWMPSVYPPRRVDDKND